MVITRANPTPDIITDSDTQGNAGDTTVSGPAPPVDLSQRVEQLSSLVEQLLAREVNRNRQDDQVTQTATALTQMTEAVAHLAQVATTRGQTADYEGDEDDGANDMDYQEGPVPEITAADPRFQPLFDLESYRLTNRRAVVTARGISRLTKRAGEIRPRITTLFSGRDSLYIIPFLSRLREVSNEAGLSEGMLLRILPDLMIEPALTAFRSAHPISYPVAVRWFLLTYAPESSVAEYWRRLQQSRQAESETPNDFALRLQLEASKLGSLVSPQELKALFEDGLVDAIRYLLRATIAPDPRKTLTDSVTTASALAKALSSNTSDSGFKSDAGRLRARRVLIADPTSPSESVPSDWRIAEDQESEDLMICYSDRELRTGNQHRETHGVRLCWTCWLPGHFSEECPVVPDHLRPEIAVRKQKALTELRRQRSEGKEGRQPGWYQPRPDRKNIRTRGGSNHAAVKSDHSSAATSKNGNGGDTSSH
jgi:hypothetical protein